MANSGQNDKKHLGPRIAIIGTLNWLNVTAELFRRGGISHEVVALQARDEILKWILKGNLWKFDAIHHVGGMNRIPGIIFALFRKKVIWHWIGSDVLKFAADYKCNGLRGWLSRLIAYRFARGHLADSPELAKELAGYGVRAEVVRLLPGAIEASVEPLPAAPGVMSYWHPSSRDFYNAPTVMKLAESMPDVQFFIAADDGKGMTAPPNVKFLGVLPNLDDIYPKVNVYLRLVKHDSLSAMVLEALARGRYVVYSKEFPFTEPAGNFEEIRQTLDELLKIRRPNYEGAKYVSENYKLQEQSDTLKQLYTKWLAGQ